MRNNEEKEEKKRKRRKKGGKRGKKRNKKRKKEENGGKMRKIGTSVYIYTGNSKHSVYIYIPVRIYIYSASIRYIYTDFQLS